MYIGLFDIWKRILQSLGFVPPGESRHFLKERPQEIRIKPPEFDSGKQVRVLLFRELNGQERRLLFDSKSVRKKDPSGSPCGKPPPHMSPRRSQESSIEKSFKLNDVQSKEYIYEWQKSSSDEQMLKEMIFGAVSISYQGTTLKVHTIRSPSQVMLSVVFPAPPVPMFRIGEQDTEESGKWNASVNELNINKQSEKPEIHLAHSVPVNVPSRLSGHYGESKDSDSDSLQSHDGYSSLPTTQLTPEAAVACLPRSSSYNSLQRRLLRNKATSIELGLQKPDESNSPNEEFSRSTGQKRVKLGLSIVISFQEENKQEKDFIQFLFTHMALIEGHLMSLKDTVVRAYLNRRNFVHFMFEGSKKFQQAISDLYMAPRLQNPEWLTIISSPNHCHRSYTFLEKFADSLKLYDKKETHFFISTLLTAVLTHHLSWVPSVIPTESKIQPSQTSHKHTPCWVDLLAKSRPYNPHWVQLSDLYGALGFPLKLAKTVVKGQNKDVVLKILQVFSYFIRCSDIYEQIYESLDGSISDTESLKTRVSRFPSGDASSSKTALSQSNSSLKAHSSVLDSKQGLPETLRASDILGAPDSSDSASDSSKDTCDLTVTPSEEKNKVHSLDSSLMPEVAASLVPISSQENQTLDNRKNSRVDSIGYISMDEKDLVNQCKRRSALQECHTNCCGGLSSAAVNSGSINIKVGKENNPTINVIPCMDKCQSKHCDTELCSKMCMPSKSKASYEKCLCYDNQLSNDSSTSEIFESPKMKECESVEEGYHSMEEPHSPSKSKLHLSEMLKRFDSWCPEGLEEVSLPELQNSTEITNSSPYKSFGWSLMAGISDHYLMDFCLQGVDGPLTEDEIRDDLIHLTHIDVLGEPPSEAVCILADTDKWTVNLLSSNFIGGEKDGSLGVRIAMSSLVSGICDAILNMIELRIPPESCIIYLEDRLQELYFRSQMLSDYLRGNRLSIPYSKIASTLNVDASDIPLLLSIATTHSPYLSVHNR
ncbi:folliculin-interacting protein 2-like [Uloborus diversus]|uniref:folliculin-interacting protein 2-like n=1 Tax=Uloborus diversus TaxID=327109 RepID=UPI00240913C2|nr:folliculin-interacting protein 2-like [Uloborus diversus]